MREKRKRPVPISELISKTARRLKIQDDVKGQRLFGIWERAMGSIAAHARPVRLKKGELTVRVDQPAWMQELSMLKPKLIKRITELAPEVSLKSIRLELGELPADMCPAGAKEIKPPMRKLSSREEKFVNLAAGEIKDPDIREAARRAIARGIERGTA